MSVIFSFDIWILFLKRILNVLYPVSVATLLFLAYLLLEPFVASVARRFFRKSPPVSRDASDTSLHASVLYVLRRSNGLTLLLSVLFCDLLARMIPFFAGIPFSHRYFYPFAALATPLAALGFVALSDALHRPISAKFPSLSKNKLSVLFLGVACLAYSGKALMPRQDKKWLRNVPYAILKATPKGEKPVLYTNYLDTRLAYYSGADLRQCFPKENFQVMELTPRQNRNNYYWKTTSKGIRKFRRRIESLGARAFLLVRAKRAEKDASLAEIQHFMRVVATFSDERRKWRFTLLQGDFDNSSKMRKRGHYSQK